MISACVPSLTPIFLILTGQKNRSSLKRGGPSYNRHLYPQNSAGIPQHLSEGPNRSQSLELIPQTFELQEQSRPSDPKSEELNARILVTNQIDQTSEPSGKTTGASDRLIVIPTVEWEVNRSK